MVSPFTTKLGTNYRPLDEEIDELQHLLAEPSSRLKRLNDEIADLHKALAKLEEERDSLSDYVEAHKALLTPVRRLPLDILQEIFVACIPTHRNCVMSAREAPILLGRICSSWRTISLSTPRLWARLHIAEPARPFQAVLYNAPPGRYAQYDNKLAQRIETTKTWLGRSGQCPLSVSLDSSTNHRPITPGAEPSHQNTHLFIQTLVAFAYRWQDISLRVPLSALDTLSGLAEDDVPMLKTFDVFQRPEPIVHSTQWESFAFLRGRNLSSFTLHGTSINPRNFPLRWDQLTTLSIMGGGWSNGPSVTSSIALEIMSRCAMLQTCHISLNDDENVGAMFQSVELRSLRSLRIVSITAGASPVRDLREMFSRLSLPELRHFDFRGTCDPDNEISFAPLLATSTNLASLQIDTQSFTKTSLIALLRGLPPTMQRLRITDRFNMWASPDLDIIDNDMVAILTPSADRPTASCPRLQELHITQCSPAFSDAALLRFIEARMASGPPTLKRIEIQFNREMQVDVRSYIQPFLDGGLQVVTKYHMPEVFPCSPWQGLPDAPPVAPWANGNMWATVV